MSLVSAELQSGQYDLPVHTGAEQLWWSVGSGKSALGNVSTSDDEHTAATASDPGGVHEALQREFQSLRLRAEGCRGSHILTLANGLKLGER